MLGNYVVFDCETGGISIEENPITQIAFLAVSKKNLEIIDRYETYVSPYNGLEVTQKSLEVTMTDINSIKKGIKLKELVKNTILFLKTAKNGDKGSIKNPILVGHNVAFDVAMLSEAFKLDGKNLSDYVSSNNGVPNTIDTLQISRMKFEPSLNENDVKSMSLINCCKRAKIELFDAHGAMNDTIATFQLFKYFQTTLIGSKSGIIQEKQEKTRKHFQI